MSKKYSIVMPYTHRPNQTYNTMLLNRHWYGERDDLEILVVEDYRNAADQEKHEALLAVLQQFPELDIRHIINPDEVLWTACSSYNLGAREACGKFLVLTCPECMHVVDNLSDMDGGYLKWSEDRYNVWSCLSVTHSGRYTDPMDWEQETGSVWYQHSRFNNRCLNFATCMLKEQYLELGGFNEEYSNGFAFADNEFINTIRKAGIEVSASDTARVFHQYHEGGGRVEHKHPGWKRNSQLYHKRWG